MTIFEAVKTTVAPRIAAEHFGLSVSRNGMVCCPFHDDRHPSMKDNRVEAKREADNVLLFMRSEGYIQLKSDNTITSADLYAIYTMWCSDNGGRMNFGSTWSGNIPIWNVARVPVRPDALTSRQGCSRRPCT